MTRPPITMTEAENDGFELRERYYEELVATPPPTQAIVEVDGLFVWIADSLGLIYLSSEEARRVAVAILRLETRPACGTCGAPAVGPYWCEKCGAT